MILVHPLIDPVIVSFGFLQIRWYSIAYILGFLIGLYLIKKINNKFSSPLKNKTIDSFFIWSVIGVILGGRLGYITFYQTNDIVDNPISFFLIWQGGMSFHGGLIGIIVATIIFCKKNNTNKFVFLDLISVSAPIGIFFEPCTPDRCPCRPFLIGIVLKYVRSKFISKFSIFQRLWYT